MKNVMGSLLVSILSVVIVFVLVAASFAPVVSLVFMVLKFCSVISFGWFWVLFPMIVSAVLWVMWIFLAIQLGEN